MTRGTFQLRRLGVETSPARRAMAGGLVAGLMRLAGVTSQPAAAAGTCIAPGGRCTEPTSCCSGRCTTSRAATSRKANARKPKAGKCVPCPAGLHYCAAYHECRECCSAADCGGVPASSHDTWCNPANGCCQTCEAGILCAECPPGRARCNGVCVENTGWNGVIGGTLTITGSRVEHGACEDEPERELARETVSITSELDCQMDFDTLRCTEVSGNATYERVAVDCEDEAGCELRSRGQGRAYVDLEIDDYDPWSLSASWFVPCSEGNAHCQDGGCAEYSAFQYVSFDLPATAQRVELEEQDNDEFQEQSLRLVFEPRLCPDASGAAATRHAGRGPDRSTAKRPARSTATNQGHRHPAPDRTRAPRERRRR